MQCTLVVTLFEKHCEARKSPKLSTPISEAGASISGTARKILWLTYIVQTIITNAFQISTKLCSHIGQALVAMDWRVVPFEGFRIEVKVRENA